MVVWGELSPRDGPWEWLGGLPSTGRESRKTLGLPLLGSLDL